MLTVFKAAFGSILTSLMTEKFAKWIILYIAELIVKSTKNQYDDKLVNEIKRVLG